jgi:DsbC/DsbD-like thiol-disulfide interchange protein
MPSLFDRAVHNVVALTLVLFPLAAHGVESAWVKTDKAEVRLLAGGGAPGSEVLAGVEIRLAKGWHTYWRYAGDAGIPPRFDWSGSQNLSSVEVLWPAPKRLPIEDGIESIGYSDGIVLPLRIRPTDAAKPVALRLKLDFGVCEKICIPAAATIALDLPPGSSPPHPEIAAAEARVPKPALLGEQDKLGVTKITLERGPNPRALIDVSKPADAKFDLFAEGPNDGWALPLPKRIASENGRARFAIPIEGAPPGADPIPAKLRLTLVAGNAAIEVLAPLD